MPPGREGHCRPACPWLCQVIQLVLTRASPVRIRRPRCSTDYQDCGRRPCRVFCRFGNLLGLQCRVGVGNFGEEYRERDPWGFYGVRGVEARGGL